MASSVLQLITGSLRLLNVVQANETPAPDDVAIAISAFDQMLDSWSNERLMVYTINPYIFHTNGGQKDYLLGPGNPILTFAITSSGASFAALSPSTVATGIAPFGITISADDSFVYCTNNGDASISQFSRDTGTGLLTALSPATVAAGNNPFEIVISADGNSVYCANNSDNTISQYSRDTGTGLLTALSPATVATGENPRGITISADGNSVYCTNSGYDTINQYSRDTVTGLLTALSPATIATGANPFGITISADGNSVYCANINDNSVSQYSRDTGTGLLTALSPATIAAGLSPQEIKISADGNSVYCTNINDASISQYSRDTGTGLLTALSPVATNNAQLPFGLTISADDSFVYCTNVSDNTISQFSRDTGTGLLTIGSTVATGWAPQCLTISGDGKSVYCTNNSDSTISQYGTAFGTYVNGTYNNVPLSGSATGTGVTATITVAGGVITAISVQNVQSGGGFGYKVGDVLTASNTNLGGFGSGFSATVASVGPGDWNVVRPLRIEQAYIIWNDPMQPQSVDIPMSMLNDAQYAAIAVKQTPSTFPFSFYDNGNFPLKTISVWPVPTLNTGIRLWLREPLIDFSDLNAIVSYPPGYERAFRFCLAVELAPEFGKTIPSEVLGTAIKSKTDLAMMNSVPQYMSGDGGLNRERKSFNWISGGFVPFGPR